MSTTQSLSLEATVRRVVTVDAIDIGHGYSVVRIQNTHERVDYLDKEYKEFNKSLGNWVESKQGIVKNTALASFLKGKVMGVVYDYDVSMMPKEFVDDAAMLGYVAAVEKHSKNVHCQNDRTYDVVVNKEAFVPVRVDHSSHMLFALDGSVLPTALVYDYMHGNMRNGVYDMTKTLAVLKTNKFITPLEDTSRGFKPRKELAWESVPYYNQSEGCSHSLAFCFSPSLEQMTLIWKKAQQLNKSYPSTALHAAVAALDILGLRNAGACLKLSRS